MDILKTKDQRKQLDSYINDTNIFDFKILI